VLVVKTRRRGESISSSERTNIMIWSESVTRVSSKTRKAEEEQSRAASTPQYIRGIQEIIRIPYEF
jgi:hypothetical protein